MALDVKSSSTASIMDTTLSANTSSKSQSPRPVSTTADTHAPTTTTATHLSNQGIEALKDILFGSIAGVVSKTLEYPFDTVKVRLQSQPDHLPLRYTGPLDCFRQSLAADGVRGLYRGVSAPLVGAMAENTCLFWAYRVSQDALRATVLPAEQGKENEKLPLPALVSAGAAAGAVTSLVLTPIELVKCRMQVPGGEPFSQSASGRRPRALSPIAIIGEVWRQEGLVGFWRGQLGTLLRETGGGAAWFGSYEVLTAYFKSRAMAASPQVSVEDISLPIWQQMIAGAAAGMSYNFAFYPADTIKSKMQTGEFASSASSARPTFLSVGRDLWHAHGLRGLYRGCGLTVARSAPSSALIFTIYEALRKALG